MADTPTPNPVEQVKNAVKALRDQKAALEKQIADIDKQLQDIADAIRGTPTPARRGRKPGRKPGPKAGSKRGGRRATPVPEEHKKALLDAMKAIGGKMRSGVAFKKAGLQKAQGKKAMAALKAEKQVKMKGPWVTVA